MAMHTRRDLLRTSLLVGGAIYTPRIWGQAPVRSYITGRFALVVAGGVAGIESLETLLRPAPAAVPAPGAVPAPAATPARTGAFTAINPAVNAQALSAGAIQLRPAYRFSFALPVLGVSQPIANWVAGSVNHAPSLQDGSFCTLDFNYKLVTRVDWTGGAISQVTWPGCEVTSTAAVLPVITVDAATATWRKGGGSALSLSRTQKHWRACDFLVTSNANINASQIASVSALTLAPTVYGGSVAFGFNVGTIGPVLLAPFQAAEQAGGMLMRGLTTDIAIQYGAPAGVSVTLHDCRVASVNSGLPRPVVIMNYADARVST